MANSIPFMDYNSLYANPLYYSNGPAMGSNFFPYYTINSEGNVVYEMPKMPEAYKEKREFFKFLKENKLFGSFCNALANQYTNKKESTYYDFATHQRQYTKKYLEPRNTAERTIQLCRQGMYGLRPQDIERYIYISFPHAWDKETPITAKMI